MSSVADADAIELIDHTTSFTEKQEKNKTLEKEEKTLRQSIEENPNSKEARLKLAKYLLDQKEFDEAEEHYNAVIKLEPENITAINDYAIMLTKSNRTNEAKKLYEKALELQPDHAIAHFNFANLLKEKLNDYQSAERHFLISIEKRPEFTAAMNNYATMLHHQLKRYNEAELYYLKALQIDANLCRESLKKYDLSQKHYVEAIMHEPTNANFYNNYGLLLQYALKELKKAQKQFETALILDDTHALAHCNYGTTLMQLVDKKYNKWYDEQLDQFDDEDNDDANEKYKEFILNAGYNDDLNKDGLNIYSTRFNGKKIEYLTKSEWHFRKSISSNKLLVMAYNNYGCLLRRLEKPELAKELFVKALTINPKFIMAKRNVDRAQQDITKKAKRGIAAKNDPNHTVNTETLINNLVKFGHNAVMSKMNKMQNAYSNTTLVKYDNPSHDHKNVEHIEENMNKNNKQKDEHSLPNKQPKSEWNCSICTFSNVAEQTQCAMCQQGTNPNAYDENKDDHQQKELQSKPNTATAFENDQRKHQKKKDALIFEEEEKKEKSSENNKKKAVELWLTEKVELPQYFQLFIEEGYDDMLTIAETMRENDLVEIGITKRGHRKKIMLFVDKLKKGHNDNENDNDNVEGVNVYDTIQ